MSPSGFVLGEQLAALERTPAVLDTLLRDGPAAWHEVDEGPGTWSAREVVGHLVHAEETNWVPRARSILEDGDRPFDPFDRFAHLVRFSEWPTRDLLDRFSLLRARNLEIVRGWTLEPERLSRRGVHPEFGAVTVRQLIATWVVHDLGHIAQACRAMARHNADDVGPWRRYLSVLRR